MNTKGMIEVWKSTPVKLIIPGGEYYLPWYNLWNNSGVDIYREWFCDKYYFKLDKEGYFWKMHNQTLYLPFIYQHKFYEVL